MNMTSQHATTNHLVHTASIPSSTASETLRPCRFCGSMKQHSFVNLGASPLCETFLTRDELNHVEPFYPLHAFVCEECFLVQVHEHVNGETIFGGEYAYFSSFSDTWLAHAKAYAEMITKRLKLDKSSLVMEVASNDGYLLKNFVAAGIPVQGIEPAENCAATAIELGVPTLVKYFGVSVSKELAEQGTRADLLIGNNVLAHVPDLNDFVAGLSILLADDGVLTMEFPHLVTTIEGNQFDTIYQEHYCYFSLTTVKQVFAHHGLTVFDVDRLTTHGGSLRVYARQTNDETKPVSPNVGEVLQDETSRGYTNIETYLDFDGKVREVKRNLLEFLIQTKREGKKVAGYGAPGKGNTLLNYCGIREDFVDYTVDRNPYKHGKFLPGSHIPVLAPEKIAETKPDYVLILPWNLKDEIMNQLEYVREWGAKFVVPIPELTVC